MSYGLKAIAKYVFVICGVLLLFYSAAMLFAVNFNFGVVLCAIVGAVLCAIGLFFESICNVKWLLIVILAALLLNLIFSLFVFIYGHNDDTDFNEAVAIVLGAGLDGDKVSAQLAYRLDKAVEYAEKNPNALIVVSGGQGKDEAVSEASAMKDYLVDNGVSVERIICEDRSTSTYTNLINTKEILDERLDGEYDVVLITSNFHMYRAKKLASAVGFDCTSYHAQIEWYSVPMRYARECVAIIKYWVTGK